MSKPQVLCVDDEIDLLEGLRLNLRKSFSVTIAESGREGLAAFDEAVEAGRGFDAVVSDMRMPEMNGAQFLTEVLARSPETPRILLSGQADLESTISAINDAKIFRFLTKPCTPELLKDTLDESMELARLRAAEHDLLDRTLRGTVGMLTEVLGLVSPSAYSRTVRIRDIVSSLCEGLDEPKSWDLDIAAMLSQVGCVVASGDEAQDRERDARVAAELLERIPRLEGVARLIRRQHATEAPRSSAGDEWDREDLHSEILRAAVLFEDRLATGLSRKDALASLRSGQEGVADFIVEGLAHARPSDEPMIDARISMAELVPGMELTADLMSQAGMKLAGAGTPITAVMLQRLRSFVDTVGVAEPIDVLAPASTLAKERLK